MANNEKGAMRIEAARSADRFYFWMERLAVFLFVFLSQHEFCLIITATTFLCTTFNYVFMAVYSTHYQLSFEFLLERYAACFVELYYFFTRNVDFWVIATTVFVGTNCLHILSLLPEGLAKKVFDSLSLSTREAAKGQELKKVEIKEASSEKTSNDELETRKYTKKDEDNSDEVQGRTQKKTSKEKSKMKEQVQCKEKAIEDQKLVENKVLMDQKDERIKELKHENEVKTVKLQDLWVKYENLMMEKAQCEQELKKTRQNYDKVCSNLEEVQNNLDASHESSGKQRLQWEEEKKNLVSMIKASTAKSLVEANAMVDKLKGGRKLVDQGHENKKDDDEVEKKKLYETSENYKKNENSFAEARLKWEEERNDLNAKLLATTSSYQYYYWAASAYGMHYDKLCEERNDLVAKLNTQTALTEYYEERWDDCEKSCRKLRDENGDLSAKLCSEIASAEHANKVKHELEDKCRRLEEEKTDLIANLCVTKAAADIYRNYMHDLHG